MNSNISVKKVFLSLIICIVCLSFLPHAFSGSTAVLKYKAPIVSQDMLKEKFSNENLVAIYDSMELNKIGLSQAAFTEAIQGYVILKEDGKLVKDDVITIADFSQSSDKKRLYIIDLSEQKVLFNTYVAHGQGTGKEMAEKFSNIAESYQSSLGFYITSNTYNGKNGYSMKLEGQESGINDKAEARSIVMHGASYVSADFINSNGYLGRSWGCPAVSQALNKPIINTIKGGSLLFIYSENASYKRKSALLNS